jgi:outer membrane protein insertion porin family/translocation and assembly module TamA
MSTLQWARTKLLSLEIAPNEVDRQFSPYSKTSLTLSLSHDRRDDALNPQRGSFSSAALEWAFPLFGVESNFQKLFFKHQQYWVLRPHVNLSALLRLGFGRGTMPIHERFFAGGSNSFRGEYFDELGPTDTASGKPVGGKLLVLLNFELTFPFILAIEDLSCLVFYEVGNVFSSRDDFQFSALENAMGFGLRYKTPLGPLRFEVGLNLNAPGGGRKVIPFITVGHMF